jgi:hypothetical protein
MKAARKGKTLEQIESEEGGPVKESLVGMAQTRRAAKRKGAVDDTDLVEDVEGIEEDLEQEEEDGMKLEAFNLKVGAGGRAECLLPAAGGRGAEGWGCGRARWPQLALSPQPGLPSKGRIAGCLPAYPALPLAAPPPAFFPLAEEHENSDHSAFHPSSRSFLQFFVSSAGGA